MATLTVDQVATLPDGVAKHYTFVRYVLGESMRDAVIIANHAAAEPLTVESMRVVQQGWGDR